MVAGARIHQDLKILMVISWAVHFARPNCSVQILCVRIGRNGTALVAYLAIHEGFLENKGAWLVARSFTEPAFLQDFP